MCSFFFLCCVIVYPKIFRHRLYRFSLLCRVTKRVTCVLNVVSCHIIVFLVNFIILFGPFQCVHFLYESSCLGGFRVLDGVFRKFSNFCIIIYLYWEIQYKVCCWLSDDRKGLIPASEVYFCWSRIYILSALVVYRILS